MYIDLGSTNRLLTNLYPKYKFGHGLSLKSLVTMSDVFGWVCLCLSQRWVQCMSLNGLSDVFSRVVKLRVLSHVLVNSWTSLQNVKIGPWDRVCNGLRSGELQVNVRWDQVSSGEGQIVLIWHLQSSTAKLAAHDFIFWLAITPLQMTLLEKVWGVLKN